MQLNNSCKHDTVISCIPHNSGNAMHKWCQSCNNQLFEGKISTQQTDPGDNHGKRTG